ncbi:alcohol dehydrogenase [Auriscalpium vulgare]|uniref:Alcohol dehydrogenase n=1 Tax=Auriscalpium vulgare TaxID=40419 RepID=A0ACB8S4U5_9AGAM|nr:alcohol dehydrogenase [Auriscalpium vulgare]
MAPVINAKTVFNEIPTGYPVPGKTTVYDTSETIDLENEPLHGGFLAKTLIIAIDPFLRNRMNIQQGTDKPGFEFGRPLSAFGLAKILRSEDPSVKAGDVIRGGQIPFQQYFVRNDATGFEILKDNHSLPWSLWVGVLGMPGHTAYVGWKEHARAKKGETIFVSAAAGSVGSLILQFAKRDGLKVIASAGSDDKVAWLRELGADVAFNYKTESTAEVLKREGPLDIYFDNVGGETLDLALENAAPRGSRFLECGMISNYNEENPYRLKNALFIIKKEIAINGFFFGSLLPKWGADFEREMPPLVKEGAIKFQEDAVRGLEHAGQSLADVQRGTVLGKRVVIVADH